MNSQKESNKQMASIPYTMRANFGESVSGEWIAVRREMEELIALGLTDETKLKQKLVNYTVEFWGQKWGLTPAQAGCIDDTIIRITYARLPSLH